MGPGILRKNFSSSSLKSLRQPSGTPPPGEESPGTRLSSSSHQPRRDGLPLEVPDLPPNLLPIIRKPGFASGNSTFLSEGIYAGDVATQRPAKDGSPSPLEPCPESFLLRPFWLMRAIYQAITHPKGGFISTRLFMPRDAWRVENVKLKNIDEKVASCDLLTAALLNLAKVDTLDADAVLEEMQAFELLLDQVQGQLARKLGAEVGVGGSMALFKSTPALDENGAANPDAPPGRAASAGGKSYLSSWKKLRSKSSGPSGLPSTFGSSNAREAAREPQAVRSLPMTASLNAKPLKRGKGDLLGIGPNAHYMASLGRLCEAAQILGSLKSPLSQPLLLYSPSA